MTSRLRAGLALVLLLVVAAAATAPALGFTNGHASRSDLEHIFIPPNAPPGSIDNDTAYLAKSGAAAAFHTMRLCAVRAGVDLYPGASQFRPAATAYRGYRIQVILWGRYKRGAGAPAAYPGTSNHGNGNAIDYATVPMATWTLHHGGRFGWSHDEGARVGEWWHYRYVGGFDRPDPGASLRYPNLRKGSGGRCQAHSVREVQRRLGLKVDGEYGKATARAVRRFQRTHHLPANGRVESRTWLKLRKLGRDLKAGRDPRTVAGNLPGQAAPMAGADVREIQGLLNARFRELGHRRYRVKVDGLAGPAFTRAVRRFQRLADRHGAHLKVTGRVNDKTYAVLLKRYARQPKHLAVTVAGVNLVADFEGFRSCPYRDVVGVWTIAFGHTSHVGPGSRCMSRRAGLRLLHRDLDLFARGVTRAVHVHVSSYQYQAIVSFSYNVGLGALQSSTLLRELNRHHYARAGNEFKRWDLAGGRHFAGLTRRRRTECELYRRGSDRRSQRGIRC